MALAPWGLERSEPDGVRVGLRVAGTAGREDVDAVSLVAELFDKELNADAYAIADGPNAIRENGNA